jgi:hypothetical protein
MADRVICEVGEGFALASDGLQWILLRRRTGNVSGWRPISFVSTGRDILARVMRQKGVPQIDADQILATLPSTFKAWCRQQEQVATAATMVRDEVEGLQTIRARVAIHEVVRI